MENINTILEMVGKNEQELVKIKSFLRTLSTHREEVQIISNKQWKEKYKVRATPKLESAIGKKRAMILTAYFNPRLYSTTEESELELRGAFSVSLLGRLAQSNVKGKNLCIDLSKQIESGKFGIETLTGGRGFSDGDGKIRISLSFLMKIDSGRFRRLDPKLENGEKGFGWVYAISAQSSDNEIQRFWKNCERIAELGLVGKELDEAFLRQIISCDIEAYKTQREPDLTVFKSLSLLPEKKPMRPAAEKDILIYGLKVWPPQKEFHGISYVDMWHLFHFWQDMDRQIAISIESPVSRGEIYRSTLSRWAKGVTPILGAFLYTVGARMIGNPELAKNTSAVPRANS